MYVGLGFHSPLVPQIRCRNFDTPEMLPQVRKIRVLKSKPSCSGFLRNFRVSRVGVLDIRSSEFRSSKITILQLKRLRYWGLASNQSPIQGICLSDFGMCMLGFLCQQ
jgi:hypothetical protein